MYIHIYIYTYIYIYVHIHAYIHTYVHTYTYLFVLYHITVYCCFAGTRGGRDGLFVREVLRLLSCKSLESKRVFPDLRIWGFRVSTVLRFHLFAYP